MKYLLLNIFLSMHLFGQAKSTIAIGPYIQNVTNHSAVVCWATLKSNSFMIQKSGKNQIIPQYENHEMILSSLKPDTEYSYDIGGKGIPEQMGTFTTFPKEIKPFQFAVLGDTRSRHDVHSKHVGRILKNKPLFVLNTGDMVGNGLDIHHWETFFDVTKNLMQSIPYFPALGNHEKDSPYYYDFFNLPNNERYYSFSVGDALFISLDLEGIQYQTPKYLKKQNRRYFWGNHEIAYFKKQKEWLEHTLNLHDDAGFIFVYFHKPLISVKKSRVEGTKMRRKVWGDLFERHGVQVVFSGHDHHYHHALSGGTHYITTAGGGASLYDIDAIQPETVKAIKTEHYILTDVNMNTAILNVIDIKGDQIDTITIDKRK